MEVLTVSLRKIHECCPAQNFRKEVKKGDRVLVSTGNGLEVGTVIDMNAKPCREKEEPKRVVRVINDDDRMVLKKNRAAAARIRPQIVTQIEKEKMDMKVTSVDYTYDRQKFFIYYTAESRVDFRNLIKILGSRLKVRIQMVQIGVRDEAAIIGAVGPCGQEVCCSKFLREMRSVNIDMAKRQELSTNPENITGCCGRLLCCLRYEDNRYK
ncbi:MAG: regulatory iron-sulfur-containing complex subunit RicT [Elusimicrobiota bacterium]|nr:regulatory iron-sulfur-containing complex subunit RicT [Elusimicrobiota bacterium]